MEGARMIEHKELYYCDDCGDRIESKTEPWLYLFKEIKTSVMLCDECKKVFIKWCRR